MDLALFGSREGFLDQLPALVLVMDADGRVVEVNRAATEILGWSREEFLEMRDGDLTVAPDEEVEAERQSFFDEGKWSGQVDIRHRDGSVRSVTMRATLVAGEDGAYRILVGFEVPDRQRALRGPDHLLAAIIDSTDDAVFAKTLDGRVLSWNRGAVRMYGYEPNEVIGNNVKMLADDEHKKEIDGILERIGRGEPVQGLETARRRKDGSLLWVSLTISPVTDTDGTTIIGASTIARDITRRHEVEEELHAAREQLEIITEGVGAGITIQDPSGAVVYANRAAAELTGVSTTEEMTRTDLKAFAERFEITDESGEPFDWDDLPGRRALKGEEECEVVMRVRDRTTGDVLWRLVRADPVFTPNGEVRFAINIFRDITTMKRDEDELRFRQALLTAEMEASEEGMLVISRDREILSFNERFREIWDLPDEVIESGSDVDAVGVAMDQVADPEAFAAGLRHYYEEHPDAIGTEIIELRNGRIIRRYTRPLIDGDRLYGRIWFFADITEERRQADRQRFLLEASRLLASSLDYEETLVKVADLAIPSLADWSAIDILADDGSIQPLAVAHRDPEMVKWAKHLKQETPTDPTQATGVPQVIRSGISELYPDVEGMLDEALAELEDRDLAEQLRRLDLRSIIIVPLTARGHRFGAMSFVLAQTERRYDEADLALAEDLAARASLAIDNARIYRERDHIASVLQKSLLPPSLPQVPGFTMDARYLPSGAGNEVGGDFYDVFETGEGTWGLTIGDVCGKGPDAAALMGLVRSSIRAAAMSVSRPSDILRITNEATLAQTTEGRFCTVAYARLVLSDAGARLTVCSGGHPLPIILRANGEVEAAGSYGSLIGAFPDVELTDDVVELFPGDSIVLYTDGVTDEQRDQEEFGEERLMNLIASMKGEPPAAITRAIHEAVTTFLSGKPRDDLAVVVARMHP